MTAIGRIDIQFPDGRSEAFQIDEAGLTVGSGCDNLIHAPNAGLAKRQLRFYLQGDAAYMTNLDASQRVTIDGESAPINRPRRLPAVAHIRAGDLNIVFNLGSDESTVAMDAVMEATQPTAATFRAEFEGDAIEVFPYSSASALVRIENLTREDGLFQLEAGGTAADWTAPQRLSFAVDGRDSAEIMFQINPPGRSDIAPGDYPLTIAISRLDGPAGVVQLVQMIRLGGYAGLSAKLDRSDFRPQAGFTLNLLNLGNQDLKLGLRAHDPDQLLDIKLDRAEIRLGAGEGAAVTGVAEARRRPILGAARENPFALLVQARPPHDYLVALPASVAVEPILRKRVFIALTLVITILILALAALLYLPPLP